MTNLSVRNQPLFYSKNKEIAPGLQPSGDFQTRYSVSDHLHIIICIGSSYISIWGIGILRIMICCYFIDCPEKRAL